IHSAMLRTWRNGWVTTRRMRFLQDTLTRPCLFNCNDHARDSIEHYVHCSKLQEAGKLVLRGQNRFSLPKGPAQSILMNDTDNEDEIIFRAVWVYIIYSAFNAVRNMDKENRQWHPKDIADLLRGQFNHLRGKTPHSDWDRSLSTPSLPCPVPFPLL
ncbi:MAG: hypothetical protein ACKPKO_05855, partial [Candidatus Fonsibacter sp.]